MAGRKSILVLAAGILFFTLPAKADLTISSKPTQNVSCSAGACSATDKKAILNVGELTAMLGSGAVTVSTGGVAKDIEVSAALSWAGTSRLTLDADKALIVKKPVTVAGSGALTISTNGGHQKVDLEFFGKGSVQFWDLSSSLVINGKSYTLVGDIATLASAIAANPSGNFALAHDYDASVDGTYSTSAIPLKFGGTFDGLGNAISNFTMRFTSGATIVFGFFQDIGASGNIRHFALTHADISGVGLAALAGILAGGNEGLIEQCAVSGTVQKRDSAGSLGGLVSSNGGTIVRSSSDAKVIGRDSKYIAGLVAFNAGIVDQSSSSGYVRTAAGFESVGGGLVGLNEAQDGRISDSFSISSVHDGKGDCCYYGGLVGDNEDGATIARTYAAGDISHNDSSESLFGGLVGNDTASPGSIADSYWDLDKGISNPAQGAGNIQNDPGITGLTTQQLQSGLPQGFDPKVWAQAPNKNNGLPFLKDAPSK